MDAPVYCKETEDHRLYHAIGCECPCFPGFTQVIADMPVERYEQEKPIIIRRIRQMSIKSALAFLAQATAGSCSDSENLKDLMLELGKDRNLYVRIYGVACTDKESDPIPPQERHQ